MSSCDSIVWQPSQRLKAATSSERGWQPAESSERDLEAVGSPWRCAEDGTSAAKRGWGAEGKSSERGLKADGSPWRYAEDGTSTAKRGWWAEG
jgi:hypothetical protein